MFFFIFIETIKSDLKLLFQALQDEVNHLRQKSDALEKITNKGTITIETLQNEHRVALEKIDQLETRLK